MIKPAMTYGLLIAAVLIFLELLTWILKVDKSFVTSLIGWATTFTVLYFSLTNWRNRYMGGYARYGQALKTGILFMFFASIIVAFYTVIYLKWIDPGAIDQQIGMLEEQFYQLGYGESEMSAFFDMAVRMKSPGFQFFSGILGGTIGGVIWSLIAAIFVKRENDPFQDAMRGVE